jgi:NADH-quinone oxidoreductase subunit N
MDKINFAVALPEIALLVAACLVLMAEVYVRDTGRMAIDRLALGALLFPVIATVAQWGTGTHYGYNDMYVADQFAHLLKMSCYIAVAVTIVYARRYGADRDMHKGEFYSLCLFALLGMMVMISANNLLMIYLGLELMSLSLYSLAALRRDSAVATEAAMKYFVLGALASGFLLYGMSMIYGGTGDLQLASIAKSFTESGTNKMVLVFGTVFLVAGLAFKFGAVPFHMWVPDVYQGTPTNATLMIAGAPKIAAFAIAFRLLVEGLMPVAKDWQQMFMVLAVLSLGLGNLIAISQSNLKRMLAYSTIAQIGFVFLGLLSGVTEGGAPRPQAYSAAMFYIITYVFTTLGTFGVIQVLARYGFEAENISDLRGLHKRSPWVALVMLALMFSLAGVPPTVGFFAKLGVLEAAINAGHVSLTVYAVLMSLIGAFYYLRIVKTMYFDEAVDRAEIEAGQDARVVLALNGAMVIVLALGSSTLIAACLEAVKQALAT